MNPPDLSFFVALERRVWQALADGDAGADAELLDPDFLGVYASGFATKDDHVAQLRDGPRVDRFRIDAPRLLPLASDAVLLSYRATFTRPGSAKAAAGQTLFISSIWKQRGANWVNVFSQDTLQVPATSPPGTESA
jgi:hypothetical protein